MPNDEIKAPYEVAQEIRELKNAQDEHQRVLLERIDQIQTAFDEKLDAQGEKIDIQTLVISKMTAEALSASIADCFENGELKEDYKKGIEVIKAKALEYKDICDPQTKKILEHIEKYAEGLAENSDINHGLTQAIIRGEIIKNREGIVENREGITENIKIQTSTLEEETITREVIGKELKKIANTLKSIYKKQEIQEEKIDKLYKPVGTRY